MMKRLAIVTAIALLSSCVFAQAAVADKYQTLLSQAAEYAANEDYDKAFAAYELARKVDPVKPDAFAAAAELYCDLEMYEDAETMADELLDVDPVSATGWQIRCLIDLKRDDIEKLDEDILYAEVSGADLKAYCQEIGEAYAKAGEEEKAAEYFSAVAVRKGGVHNDRLDELFRSGSVSLEETLFGELKVEPSEYGAVLKSVSPAGNSALLWNEQEATAYAIYDNNILPVLPSDGRGVEDTFGKRAMMFDMGLGRWIGREGITWSHNGKYAVITNSQIAMSQMRFHDPLIIDMETGETFLPVTSPGNPLKEEGSATAVSACFSLDDQFLYYSQYGVGQEARYSIYSYNLETGQNILCWNGEWEIYRPQLHETPGGALVNLMIPSRMTQEFGICRFAPENGEYEDEFIGSGLSLESAKAVPGMLSYSANSGYGICEMESPTYAMSGYDIFFQCFCPDQGFDQYDRMFAIPLEDKQIVEISNQDMDTIPEKERISSYYRLQLMRQSPDGYYAIVLGRDQMSDISRLLLVSLADMTYVEVEGVQAASIDISKIDREPIIEWNAENLLIQTGDGVKTFVFK